MSAPITIYLTPWVGAVDNQGHQARLYGLVEPVVDAGYQITLTTVLQRIKRAVLSIIDRKRTVMEVDRVRRC